MPPTLLSRPRGWSPEFTHSGGLRSERVWMDCPTCWRQGRILELRPGGIAYAHTCGTCLGVGQVSMNRRT
jgi:DnaJ-class molecular chaperone